MQKQYKATAGFAIESLNQQPSLIETGERVSH